MINYPRHIFLLLLLLLSGLSVRGQDTFSDQTLKRDFQAPEKIKVNNVFIIGNEKTRRTIIQREMNLTSNTTYDWDDFMFLLEEDQTKIYNLQLFTSVEITPIFIENDQVELLISVKERWYVMPGIIFTLADRNFSEWWVNQNRDFSRVNYGVKLNHNNVGGRNEKLKVIAQFGFTQAFEVLYSKPYIDANQQHGLSAQVTYFTNRTIPIRSVDNRQIFFTNEEENILRRNLSATMRYTFRGSFYNFHHVSLGFNRTEVHQDVLRQNPAFFLHDSNQLHFFTAGYSYRHDKRDNIAYATEGQLLNVGINRYGLFTNDDVNETEIAMVANKYTPLGSSKFHLVTGISGTSYLSPRQPYILVRGIGYNPHFIRGYELNVIEGQQTIVHKSSLRYELLNMNLDLSQHSPIEALSYFPVRMYLSANFDQGYVRDRNYLPENTRLTNKHLFGYGIGLDLVTFYDNVFRFEYSVNDQGLANFFINFTAPL